MNLEPTIQVTGRGTELVRHSGNLYPTRLQVCVVAVWGIEFAKGKTVYRKMSFTRHLRFVDGVYIGRALPGYKAGFWRYIVPATADGKHDFPDPQRVGGDGLLLDERKAA